jgi:hypothetical protein
MKVQIAIEWEVLPGSGQIEIAHGRLLEMKLADAQGAVTDGQWNCPQGGRCRLDLTIEADNTGVGANPTMVSVRAATNPFTFFLRDVCEAFPIVIPGYGVSVAPAGDKRTYADIRSAVGANHRRTRFQQIDLEPEETYDSAAAHTRELESPIWMGISRDVRVFEMGLRQPMRYTDWIQPRFHGHDYFYPEKEFWPENEYRCDRYGFDAGRGWGCTERAWRRLDEGVLPILHVQRIDDDIEYEQTAFVSLEATPHTAQGIRGTHYHVADGLSVCNTLTGDEEQQSKSMREQELKRDEETVFFCRIVATNTAKVPRYAFFKAVYPHARFGDPVPHTFEQDSGFGLHKGSQDVFAISKLNGSPMPQQEVSILLQPGASCTYEFFLPHSPIPRKRAEALARRDLQACLDRCRSFWKNKLSSAASIRVPEQRIDEMLRACLLHMDLATYGHEPDGVLMASNGVYSTVAMETTANISYYDSIGWHDVARRCLDFFFCKQRDDGFIQLFSGYMLDTGCFLWAVSEHYRYTRDDAWLRHIAPKVLKSCRYILGLREQNKNEALRGRGYGLLEGKVADPEDGERIFMLNGAACLGLSRAAELFSQIDPNESQRLKAEAESFKEDIRAAYFEELARGPVIPLGDGTWRPTAPPWIGPRGPVCLFADGKPCWTHGAVTLRDDLLGPLYLVFQEVIEPDEEAATIILDYHSELMWSRNASFSQPYLGRQAFAHLRRGETKRFLKTYYNTLASLADRQTYSFWEHYYHESPHKTAELAQFLMQTRCMLYLEDRQTLKLLQGVPRAWLEDGKTIELNNAASYFGPLTFSVVSRLSQGCIEVDLTCDSSHRPRSVEVRVPHPDEARAISVEGGTYDRDRETVTVEAFKGRATVRVYFQV